MTTSEEKQESGRDIVAALDGFQQALHQMMAPLSRYMTPEEITAARAALEMAEAKITKLKIRFPKR